MQLPKTAQPLSPLEIKVLLGAIVTFFKLKRIFVCLFVLHSPKWYCDKLYHGVIPSNVCSDSQDTPISHNIKKTGEINNIVTMQCLSRKS